jgi:two-component system, sporulation sensor kinase A
LDFQFDSQGTDFRQIVENSLNAIWILSHDGNILYCNKACIDLLKIETSKDIFSKKAWNFLHPDFHDIGKERLKKILFNKEKLETIEVQMITSDGEVIFVELKSVPFYKDNKVFAQVIMQNITQRKVTEKLLNNSKNLASLGQLTAGIAHEVKNPLTAVKGFLQLMKEFSPHSYLHIMESELNKALNTLQELLQVSKPDLHDEPLVPIHFCHELTHIVSLFQEKLYKVEIEMDLRDSEKRIIGRRNLFQKAIFNLIKNAVEAIEDKGKIKIEHYFEHEWIHIKISDSGIGIAPEKLNLLGTPFFTSKSEGTGLGLTQVYTTINEQNGVISVQSKFGEGTTFHIQLPVKTD